MTKSGGRAEYEAYLKYLWDRDAQEPARRYRRRRHPLEWDEEFEYPLNELAAANRMLGAMSSLHDPYDAFRARALAGVLRQVRTGVTSNTRMLDEMGLLRTLDAEYSVIARQMRVEDLPLGEQEMLSRYGFDDVADHLPGVIYAVRSHARERSGFQELSVSQELRRLAERLDAAAADHDRLQEIEDEITVIRSQNERPQVPAELASEQDSRRKERRWWKGIGQIVQGAAMSLADGALAVGALKFDVSDETKTWGALVSVTAGVGTVMSGIGDLRGE
jgi:hypothetical protein